MAAALDLRCIDLFEWQSATTQAVAIVDLQIKSQTFYILENTDGSMPADIEVPIVSTAALSRKDMFVTVTLPILLSVAALLAVAGGMYSRLDDAIDNQRLEIKADLTSLSSQMSEANKAIGSVQGDLSKVSGEIVKAKGEVIQKLSELSARQTILEAKN